MTQARWTSELSQALNQTPPDAHALQRLLRRDEARAAPSELGPELQRAADLVLGMLHTEEILS